MLLASRHLVPSRLTVALLLTLGVGLAACDAMLTPPVDPPVDPPVGPVGPLDGTYAGTYRVDYLPSPSNEARAVFDLEEENGQVQGTVTFVYVSGNEATRDVSGTYTEPTFDLVFAGSFFRGTASPDGDELTGEMGANEAGVALTVRRE